MIRISIFHAGDPVGFVPSGIDAFVRGILRWAPSDLEYVFHGASSDTLARPLDKEIRIAGLNREAIFVPLVALDAQGRRSRMPLTLRYLAALRRKTRTEPLRSSHIFDFHRPEIAMLFGRDARPQNLFLHQDMAVIRDKNSDIRWRHAPWLYEVLERRVLRRASHVFCVRESAVDRYRAAWPDRPTAFSFIPTWVDTDIFRPAPSEEERRAQRYRMREQLGCPPNATLLAFVGRLDRQKNPQLLLEAFGRTRLKLPNVRLVVVGDGVLRPQMEAWLKKNQLESAVHLLGAQPREYIAQLLRASDMFLLSSAYEGMPISVLEALASGLPVVGTNVGELSRLVRDGVNVILSSEQSADSLARAIVAAESRLIAMRGATCTSSVVEYGPHAVLGRIYDHHRNQAREFQLAR